MVRPKRYVTHVVITRMSTQRTQRPGITATRPDHYCNAGQDGHNVFHPLNTLVSDGQYPVICRWLERRPEQRVN